VIAGFTYKARKSMSNQAPDHSREEAVSMPRVWALAVGHGTVDVYGSFLVPLFPLFAVKFGLSLTLVGTLASILTIADGISQPLFGYLGDRMRRPWMVMVAPVSVGLATGVMGLATGYWMLALFLMLAGMGRSAYHPQAAAAITQYAGPRKGLSMSLFTAAGNVGFASGPLLATALVALSGLPGTLYSIPLGLMITALLYALVFQDARFRPPSWSPPPLRAVLGDLRSQMGMFSRLWSIVVLRSLTYFSLFTFLPIVFARHGLSAISTGALVSLFLYGGALGGILGGWLSDRLGERTVIVGSLALSFPALQLALLLEGALGTFLLMIGGFWLLASAPVTIALAQRFAPLAIATVSSLMLGLGWGIGGLMVTPVGVMADHVGPTTALRIQGLCLIVAVFLALRLPAAKYSRAKT
jgi:FSR family fosmidomycin resistance protein-like MFS transporter